MNQLQAMRVFLQVAESGSFGGAATNLKLSNAVITRYVALLEAHLNTQLLQRTTRCLCLTEAGGALMQMDAVISSSKLKPLKPMQRKCQACHAGP